jgi:hypothetical protein
MTRVRRINVSQVEGREVNNTNDDEIRPFGEAAIYIDGNGPTNKPVLTIHDGVRTHLRSKVLEPGVLYGSNGDAGDGSGADTIKLIPDSALHYSAGSYGNDQYLIVDPTDPGHIHLRAGGAIDNSNAELIIGGENSNLRVASGVDPTVYIKSNNNQWTFNTDGKLVLPGNSYGNGSDPTVFGDYGVNLRPSWNNIGTGPELSVAWNDGIEISPITNDHVTGSNKTTPFFITGSDASVSGRLPGDVWIDGGRNGLDDVNGTVNIGRSRTDTVNIGQAGVDTTITFSDGTSINSTTGLGGASTGDFTFTANTIETDNGAAAVVISINGDDGATPTPAFIQKKWSFATDGSINFLDPFLNTADASITTTKVGNWDTAYGWGDHSGAGYLTAVPDDGFESKSTATGVVTHDCATNKVFVHSSISADFTADLTNLNLAAGTATNITLVLNQGATAYICNALQIGGVAQTINWQGSSSAPTGNSNKKDVMSFSILNVAGTYTVLGQLVSFG